MKSGMQRPRSYSRSRHSSSGKSSLSRASSTDRSQRSPTPKDQDKFRKQKRGGSQRTRKDKHKDKYSKTEDDKVGKAKSSKCAKCASNTHKSADCKRYPFFYETFCRHCKERDLLLYHPESLCRFQSSRYRTPRPSKSPESFRNKSKSPSFLDNLEKFNNQKN